MASRQRRRALRKSADPTRPGPRKAQPATRRPPRGSWPKRWRWVRAGRWAG